MLRPLAEYKPAQPTPADLDECARAHIAHARADYGELVAQVDDDVWHRAVVAHLEPLPADREWRVKHRPMSPRRLTRALQACS